MRSRVEYKVVVFVSADIMLVGECRLEINDKRPRFRIGSAGSYKAAINSPERIRCAI